MPPGMTPESMTQPLPEIREAYPVIDTSFFAGHSFSYWLGWTIGVALVISIVVYLLWKKNKKAPPGLSPYERVQRDLREAKEFLKQNGIQEFCTVLSQALRKYIEAKKDIRAMELTTEEFCQLLQGRPRFDKEDTEDLIHVFSHCDHIRFAKLDPDRDELMALLDIAKKFVEKQNNKENLYTQ